MSILRDGYGTYVVIVLQMLDFRNRLGSTAWNRASWTTVKGCTLVVKASIHRLVDAMID